MADDMPSDSKQPWRPLLAGGEKLREEADRVRGGGQPWLPYDHDHGRRILLPQADQLREDVAAIPEELRAAHVVVEAKLLPNFIAASHFPDALLNSVDLYQVGTRNTLGTYRTPKRVRENEPTKCLLLAGPEPSFVALAGLVRSLPQTNRERRLWDQLIRIDRLGLADANTVVRSLPSEYGAGEILTWEAVLSSVGRTERERSALEDEAFQKWIHFIERLGGEVDVEYRRQAGRLMFVPVALPVEAILETPQFNLLRAIRPMPKVRPLPTRILRVAPPQAPRPPTDPTPASDARVAIFDGGLNSRSSYFGPFAVAKDLTSEAPDAACLEHGSLVTSALLYGPMEEGVQLPRPDCYVDHYRVLPPPKSEAFDHSLYWLLDQIVSTVAAQGYRLVSLSVGPDCPVEDDGEPHRWTAELDALAAEHGVLFLTAVGNNGQEDDVLGFNRVQVPADMVNGVGVGACAVRNPAKRLERADYSAVGPGRHGQRMQPVGVAFGGSLEGEPFVGLNHRDQLVEAAGTSFATPLAMRGLVQLAANIGPNRVTPELLRTFAAHFAVRGRRGHKLTELGFGRLREDYAEIWQCPLDSVSVLYEDELARGELVAMRIPVPDGLPIGTRVRLAWTLGYTSDVDPSDAAEYTRSGLEVVFRPHENIRALYDGATNRKIREVDIVRDRDVIAGLAASRPVRWGDTPVAAGNWRKGRTEAALRLSGKWETLLRGEISRPAERLHRPRLDLAHLARAEGVLVSHNIQPLLITLIVTVSTQGVPLYDLVRREYSVLTPLLHQIRIPVPAA